MSKTTGLAEFSAVWPVLTAVLLEYAAKEMPPDELEAYESNLNTNCQGGKRNRGRTVPDTVSILIGAPLSPDQHLLASALGWTTELFQASCLVADDMMDRSVTRRGQPCWYRRAEVGLLATRDGFMLELGAYMLLEHFFATHPEYVQMVELFHETTCQTEVGQLLDLLTAPEGTQANLEGFSLEKYRFIVTYKTSYYSFYLPVALALHLCQIATPKNLEQAEEIFVAMGEYFQVQDDFLDAFAPPEQLGKIGTDIVDNKCTWLVNQALLTATPEQRKTLLANYGKHSKHNEDAVRRLYDEMNLRQRYMDYEEQRVVEIREMIAAVDESEGLKKEVFESFLSKIYRRSK